MLKSTEKFAETTNIDVVDDALRSLRVTGSLLLREAYGPAVVNFDSDCRAAGETAQRDA